MTDAELLKTLMDTMGCSNQTEVGDILGVTQASISGVMAGKKHLGGSARKFAKHLLADAASEKEPPVQTNRATAHQNGVGAIMPEII